MKVANSSALARSRRRPGFTLVELLVVITIIAALAALTMSATTRFIAISETRTTETRIQKIYDILNKHWQTVAAKAYKDESLDQLPSNVQTALLNLAGNDATRARVIYVNLRLKQEFPINFSEITSPNLLGLPSLPTYAGAVAGKSNFSAAQQCSACLLLALSQARAGIVTNREDFGSDAVQSMSNSNNSALMPGFVDAWNNPLIFTRWPVNSEVNGLNPAKTGTQAKLADPQDAKGLLLTPSWYRSANRTKFESLCHPISADNGNTALYMVPVIWSFGPDKKASLSLTDLSGNGGTTDYDNIYSYRLRLGGS